jgi:hypothetical protein
MELEQEDPIEAEVKRIRAEKEAKQKMLASQTEALKKKPYFNLLILIILQILQMMLMVMMLRHH